MERRVILITGANRGIGFETARKLGQQGHIVLLGARDPNKGAVAAQALRDEGLNAYVVELDVTSERSIEGAAGFVAERFGTLDSLVNNAAVSMERGELATQVSPMEVWRRTLETNVVAVVAVTQALLPLLRKSPAGRIVQVSSNMGSLILHADPTSAIYHCKTAAAYDASKAALNSFTIHLAYELRETPIKVNSAHPGWVKTDLGGEDAPMKLAEGAQTSVWLATLPQQGPSGGFYHLGEAIPW